MNEVRRDTHELDNIQQSLSVFVNSFVFEFMSALAILANLILQSLRRHGMDTEEDPFLGITKVETWNLDLFWHILCCWVYACSMLGYFRHLWDYLLHCLHLGNYCENRCHRLLSGDFLYALLAATFKPHVSLITFSSYFLKNERVTSIILWVA